MKTLLAVSTALLVCLSVTDAGAQTYDFAANSQGWRFMGQYDGGGLTPLPDFRTSKNPWTGIDGDGGAIGLGQEGSTPVSPSGALWLHGDLNSPDLTLRTGRSFVLSYDITGSHMTSEATVWVQAVLVVRQPNDISDRRIASDFEEVPLGENGAWDTHAYSPRLPAGTIVKKVNLRIFLETATPYDGWIMVDNVVLR